MKQMIVQQHRREKEQYKQVSTLWAIFCTSTACCCLRTTCTPRALSAAVHASVCTLEHDWSMHGFNSVFVPILTTLNVVFCEQSRLGTRQMPCANCGSVFSESVSNCKTSKRSWLCVNLLQPPARHRSRTAPLQAACNVFRLYSCLGAPTRRELWTWRTVLMQVETILPFTRSAGCFHAASMSCCFYISGA